MPDRRVFVFRVDYGGNYDYIKSELYAGKLRQGWGPGSLLDSDGEPSSEAYIQTYLKTWPDDSIESAQRRYDILSPMLDMKAGDLIVVPRMPERWGETKFVIVEVSGSYRFELTTVEHGDDFGHVIPVNPDRIVEVRYDASVEARVASGKFRAYQNAVNNVWNSPFTEAVANLWEGQYSGAESVNSWANDLRGRLVEYSGGLIASLRPGDIENLVKRAFTQAGYEFLYGHRWDREGGDADLVFKHSLPLLSEVDDDDLKVFVQVKHKAGSDANDREGIEQLDRITKGERYTLKVLFSTAESFSEETELYAQEKEVVLISGMDAIAFLARGLM